MLFEVPPPAPIDRGGRPRWNKVHEYQELVEALIEFGALQPAIAKAVGVSVPTLAHYFSGTPAWQARWGRRSRATTQTEKVQHD